MGQDEDALEGLPEPGKPVFYPKVGHCVLRGVTEDRVAPDTRLLELEDLEEGSRILIPLHRVPQLNLRPAGLAFEGIKEVLSSEFEEPLESEEERHALIERLVTDGSATSLAKALKHLHLVRQTDGLSREEEQTRKKIRSWLAAEVSLARESTRAEAQAFLTRVLQEAMAGHRQREKEEAKQRRRAARQQRKADEEALRAEGASSDAAELPMEPPVEAEAEPEKEPQTATESEREPVTESGAHEETEAAPDDDAEADARSRSATETETESRNESETETNEIGTRKTEPTAEADSDSKSVSSSETESAIETDDGYGSSPDATASADAPGGYDGVSIVGVSKGEWRFT